MYKPWYYKRRCPLFFDLLIPTYRLVQPHKTNLLLSSLIIWLIGALTLICIIIACTAVHCTAFAAALIPLSCLAMWIGYFVFHCAWASHLLDQPDVEEENLKNIHLKEIEHPFSDVHDDDHPLSELAKQEEAEVVKETGFWKFVNDEPWQVKCNRNELR